jgi:hypothetical protein
MYRAGTATDAEKVNLFFVPTEQAAIPLAARGAKKA